MKRRSAAALLCGAAAISLAEAATWAIDLLSPARGPLPTVVLLALPAVLFARVAWDAGAAAVLFLAGAAVGFVALEWWMLEAFGHVAAIIAGVTAMAVAHGLRRGAKPVATPPRAGLLLGVVLGCAAGFLATILRPFLFEHVAPTRSGVRIAIVVGLLGLCAGALVGQSLKRRLPRAAVGSTGILLMLGGFVTTALVIPRAVGGLVVPGSLGSWADTWWGRSLLASWAMLGLLTLGMGVATPLLDRWRAVAMFVAGFCAGAWAGVEVIARMGANHDALVNLADVATRHPPMQRVTEAAIDPGGFWTRYRIRTALELESVAFRSGTRVDRGILWRNLEQAECEPLWTVAPSVIGRTPGDLAFGPTTAPRGGDVVVRSIGFLPSGQARVHVVGTLRDLAGRASSLRVWCDPRALTPEGVRTLLATWREALPDATLLVLADGFNGPLLGVQVGGDGGHAHVTEALTLFRAPIATALRGDLGPAATCSRPLLEWRVDPDPSPFPHPRGDVMRALAGCLAIPETDPRADLLSALVLHAGAQAVRAYVVSPWDHVTIADGEIAAVMAAFARDERCPPVVRHLQILLEVLLQKREYALLVRTGEEAVARRPDVFEFHRTLGKAYFEIRDHANAVEELEFALRLRPDHHDVVLELSRALGAARRHGEAVALLEAESLRNRDAAVDKGLAISVFESGDHVRAEGLLREFLQRFPADLDVMRALDRIDRGKATESR